MWIMWTVDDRETLRGYVTDLHNTHHETQAEARCGRCRMNVDLRGLCRARREGKAQKTQRRAAKMLSFKVARERGGFMLVGRSKEYASGDGLSSL